MSFLKGRCPLQACSARDICEFLMRHQRLNTVTECWIALEVSYVVKRNWNSRENGSVILTGAAKSQQYAG
jgi:hypothetical protein